MPECRCGEPNPSRAASIARAISRRRAFGKRRTAARNGCERSICNISFQIARVAFDCASFTCARDSFVHALHEPVELLLCHAVLLKRIIIRVHSHRSKGDHFVAVQNADIFAIRGAFQQRGQVCARAGRRECCHASILRRYGEQLKRHCYHLLEAPHTAEVISMKMPLHRFVIVLVFFGAFQQLPAATDDHVDIKAEVAKRHDEAVKRLQAWIGQVSIAAENRGYPEGAEYMAKLARDAGFQQVTVINTDGKPGVFATLDAGAEKTVGLYFMYDVKQFDPAEWTSPPTEARIVDKPPLGKVIVGRGAVNQKGPEA